MKRWRSEIAIHLEPGVVGVALGWTAISERRWRCSGFWKGMVEDETMALGDRHPPRAGVVGVALGWTAISERRWRCSGFWKGAVEYETMALGDRHPPWPGVEKFVAIGVGASAFDAMMKSYPSQLYHAVPEWVTKGAIFHIRGRCERGNMVPLTAPAVGPSLLSSVAFYHTHQRWHVTLFVLMPDHWHALLSFSSEEMMTRVVGDWKRYQEKTHGILWQEGFFDHRIRGDAELVEKSHYLRMNPVRACLCANADDWPMRLEKVDGDLRAPAII